MRTPQKSLFGLLFAACAAAATLPARAEPSGTALAYPLFDANRCLTGLRTLHEEGTVEFIWGCAEKKIITISCVFDRAGYSGLGPRFARPGWHCNHPLPVLGDEKADRVSDVAVGDPRGRSVWAACAVPDLGEFAARVKPYHGTACYRAMIGIGAAVSRTGRHPAEVAAEFLQ